MTRLNELTSDSAKAPSEPIVIAAISGPRSRGRRSVVDGRGQHPGRRGDDHDDAERDRGLLDDRVDRHRAAGGDRGLQRRAGRACRCPSWTGRCSRSGRCCVALNSSERRNTGLLLCMWSLLEAGGGVAVTGHLNKPILSGLTGSNAGRGCVRSPSRRRTTDSVPMTAPACPARRSRTSWSWSTSCRRSSGPTTTATGASTCAGASSATCGSPPAPSASSRPSPSSSRWWPSGPRCSRCSSRWAASAGWSSTSRASSATSSRSSSSRPGG